MPFSLVQIREQLQEYNPVRSAIKDVKAAIALIVCADPQPGDENCVMQLREDLPPGTLYSQEMVNGPTTLYRLLRDYLVLKGCHYQQHPESNRISFGLPGTLYDNQVDRDIALQALRNARSTITSNNQPEVVNNSRVTTMHEEPSTRVAHNMAVRFKGYEKFSGKMGEDLEEHINNHIDAAKDYRLTLEQRLDFFHHIFDGEAKTFYRLKVDGVAASFAEALQMLRKEYNSITRQSRVRRHLQSLRLNDIMAKKKLTVTEALEQVRETITRLAPQGPLIHRNDEDKVEYLYKAVVGAEWAKNALSSSQSSNPPWNFQQLYSALDAAWLQEQEEKEARKRDHKPSSSKLNNETVPGLFFQGQGFYGRPRQRGSKSSNPYPSKRRKAYFNSNSRTSGAGRNGNDRDGNPRVCHNCGSPDHFIRDCDQPRNLTRNIGQMLRKTPNDAKRILFELCQQSEEALFENDESPFFDEDDHGDDQDDEEDDDEDEDQEANNHYNEVLEGIKERRPE